MTPRHFALPLLVAGSLLSNLAWLRRSSAPGDLDVARGVSRAMQEIAARVTPAVVGVTSFRGQGGVTVGSGVFVDADGVIVTNHHVIDGAREVSVSLLDGRRMSARVRGSDKGTDLAVLQVAGDDLPFALLSEDAPPGIGSWVLAVGNPDGLDHTVTFGIVSARGRSGLNIADYEDFLQTDAAINFGNSGGPLIDLEGRVVGINTAVWQGNQGLSFAIPAYMVREVVAEILEKGFVDRGWFGIRVRDLSEARAVGLAGEARVAVDFVFPGSPAAAAGLQLGDIVLAIGDRTVPDQRTLLDAIARLEPGARVPVEVWRDGRRQRLAVDVGERPSDP